MVISETKCAIRAISPRKELKVECDCKNMAKSARNRNDWLCKSGEFDWSWGSDDTYIICVSQSLDIFGIFPFTDQLPIYFSLSKIYFVN